MADYKKMYFLLFQEISEVIDTLQKIQEKTEELYISSESSRDSTLFLVDPFKKNI